MNSLIYTKHRDINELIVMLNRQASALCPSNFAEFCAMPFITIQHFMLAYSTLVKEKHCYNTLYNMCNIWTSDIYCVLWTLTNNRLPIKLSV